jgi:hypothetical protein
MSRRHAAIPERWTTRASRDISRHRGAEAISLEWIAAPMIVSFAPTPHACQKLTAEAQ